MDNRDEMEKTGKCKHCGHQIIFYGNIKPEWLHFDGVAGVNVWAAKDCGSCVTGCECEKPEVKE